MKQIKGCTTSHEVWLKVQSIYQSRGRARKATLLKQLTLSKMNDGKDVREHISKMFDIIDKLEEMSVKIDPDLLTVMLLYSLPPTFENFSCAIESRDELPTPEVIRIKIIEENDARKNETRSTMQNAMFTKKSWNSNKNKNVNREQENREFKYRCHKCKERVHKASECKAKKAEYTKKSQGVSLCANENFDDTNEIKALHVDNEVRNVKRWCLHSGATSHICKCYALYIYKKKC